MKARILKFGVLFIILLFISCNRDNENTITDETEVFTEEIEISASLSGLVVDIDGNPLAQVALQLGEKTATTDENGVFRFSEVDISSGGSVVKGTKQGYYDAFKFVYAQEDKESHLRVKMVTKEVIGSFSSTESFNAVINGGAKIELPSNGIIRADGSPYSGQVEISAHWYGPDSDDLAVTMPGDLRGLDTEGNSVQLITYGMMAVELQTLQGEALQLAEGSVAKLSFPIVTGSDPAQSIPMWHLDEDSGIWIEEGEAQKQGDFMEAEVSHFSFWNCDAPFDVICIDGRLITTEGEVISGQLITITNENNLTAGGVTNIDGIFQGKIPAGIALLIVIEVCGERMEIPLGPLSQNTPLGDIVINGFESKHVFSNLIDCDSDPVEEGYMLIRFDGETILASANEDGEVAVTFLVCENTEGEYFAYDIKESQQSEIRTFDSMQEEINEPDFVVCKDLTEEFITFSGPTGSQELTLNDAEVTILDDKYIHIYAASSEGSIDMMYLKDPGQSSDFMASITVAPPGSPVYPSIPAPSPYLFDPNQVEEVGDFVIGSRNSVPPFNFVLKVDRKVASATVTGEIWQDDNMDGIKDTTEPRVEGLRMGTLHTSIFVTGQIDSSAVDGKFEFNLLVPGRPLSLTYGFLGSQTGPIPTLANVGSDNFDSDFVQQGTINSWKTIEFIPQPGETITNLDLGILP